ncbi:hypothetical protein A9Q86_00015 [Flavobacteriales bacterium 33_180_T64]|nr:hypothetical protein A9Q86_00015 [Flavobacteriales bacterium 33_180_T64]
MENKTGKYLKYAFGEITLVVVGILIALGINNWNENRKNIQAEKVILNNIYENLISDSIQFDYYKSQYKQIERLHVELYEIGFKDEIIDSISEPILIRRTLHFKQLIDSDFKENSKEINNFKVREAIILYTKSITSMEHIYLIGVERLIEQRLKPYLAEQKLYNPQNWFELKNKTFSGFEFKETKGKNIIDEHGLIASAKTQKFQQILLTLNIKWNEFNSRLLTVIEENNKLRELIKSELKNY